MAKNYNPNKNVHHKKKNSNYHGYSAQRADAAARKAEEQKQQERQPVWVSVLMFLIFAVLIAVLVMMNSDLKESVFMAHAATLAIGICCGLLVFLQRFSKKPPKNFQIILSIVLFVMSVVYICMGAYGLIKLL